MTAQKQTSNLSETDYDKMVETADAGARDPNPLISKALFYVCLLWALFQIYIATPLPFMLDFLLLNNILQRSIHLAFALFLVFCYFPRSKRAPVQQIPVYDWLLGVIGAATCGYILIFYIDIAERAGAVRTTSEIVAAVVGILALLEATRRAIGFPLVVVCCAFILYAFYGYIMPEVISHKGLSINKFVEHMWFSTEGVFGLPLGVSNSFIFLYVVFGTLLERAGAGSYFIRMSFALLGHLKGGPAKAAVVSSAMTGIISGSAIANVVTTGTFTIPLMKKMGFSAEKAGAIEVSSSINGQLMPPIMGAAAFIMTEFIGISYFEVIKHAFLPAVLAYFGLYCIVHIEALKTNMPTLRRAVEKPFGARMVGIFLGVLAVIISMSLVYFFFSLIKHIFGGYTSIVVICTLVAAFLAMTKVAARYQDPSADQQILDSMVMPAMLPTFLSGMYYLLPVGVLIWCLMVERWSPELSVIWAIAVIISQMVAQKPLIRLMQGHQVRLFEFIGAIGEVAVALARGARNMVTVVIAMAAAGIIVGVVSATGLGLLMSEIVQTVSGGNVVIMLLMTAVLCVILGMGLPTTANYIVVASVMANSLVILAAQNGLSIPLIAIHLFVFYFGLISGTTPPVAVDAYAGAAVAGSNPVKTCIQAFIYDLRTSLLPFIFVFNQQLLLMGFDHWWEIVLTLAAAAMAMMAFASATQRFYKVRNRWWETVAMLLIAFTLLRPGYWLDMVQAPYYHIELSELEQAVSQEPDEAMLLLHVKGENISGEEVSRNVLLPLGKKDADAEKRLLHNTGLDIEIDGESWVAADIRLNSPAQTAGIEFDWQIVWAKLQAERFAKQWFYIPAAGLFWLIFVLQSRRKMKRNGLNQEVRQKAGDALAV